MQIKQQLERVTYIDTVARALCLLKLLAISPLRVQEAAEKLGIHKSSASRLLSTMRDHNFVRLNSNGKYELGYAVFEMAHALSEGMDVRKIGRPFLEQLNKTSNETVHLAVLDGIEIVYLDKIDTSRPIRMYSRIGKRAHVYCTGVGKALLAYLPDEKIDQILAQIKMKSFTARTIVDREHMMNEIREIRVNGIAWDRGEHEDDIYCMAAPVFDFTNKVIASISISATITYTPEEELAKYAGLLSQTAEAFSRAMGYVGDWPPPVRL
ncbi:IclR family transcriptional regulator [Thermincola ferriacetica]|uniref:IclR family transcriptional regulator n=1 Tax=Thermincola ferriacetica TaxID=281456 RepID=UPI00068E9F21|nr:IclR family transcriptional regulator [Thermincola ferriacetica]